MAAFNQIATVGGKGLAEWMANGEPSIDSFAHPTGRTLALGCIRVDVAASSTACDVEAIGTPRPPTRRKLTGTAPRPAPTG